MKHGIDFFKDEIRNGFYIPTAIKQSWACSLDVLSEIDRICQKHNITYFADWGSMLATVRHGGFVPWDDDIDICMKRDDYNKFRAVADSELPSGYSIHDYERHENHWLFLSRIVGSQRINFDEKYLDSHYNFPWLSAVDIFVKDYLYKDPIEEKKRCDEILYIITIADMIIRKNYDSLQINNKLSDLEEKYSVSLRKFKDDRSLCIALYKLAEKQMARVPKEQSDSIGQIFPWIMKGVAGEPSVFYEKSVYLPFEDTRIPVPLYYNEALSRRYGNYNEIRKVWDGHAYPAFENQRMTFEKETGSRFPRFEFTTTLLERAVPDKSGSIKELAKECLEALKSQYLDCCKIAERNDPSALASLFNEMQNLSADLGTTIENVKGENSPHTRNIVKVLEHLNEKIYEIYQYILNKKKSDLNEIGEILADLEKVLFTELINRKEVLFLPVGPIEWNVFEKYYEKALNSPDTDIFVVPLPLMHKNFFGQIKFDEAEIKASLHLNGYPSSLILTSWEAYDLSLHCPDTIYFQNPYDETNPCLTLPGCYYSKNLQRYTENLVYIPIGSTSDFTETDYTDQVNLKFYVTTPGLFYADKVIVQSENIKKQYVNALCGFSDESYRKKYESKIIFDSQVFEKKYPVVNHSRKEILYCISMYELNEHSKNLKDKLTERINIFNENADKIHVSLCIYPETSDLKEYVLSIADNLNLEYDYLSFNLKNIEKFTSQFDAYYGSSSPLVPVFCGQKKPVMICNYNI